MSAALLDHPRWHPEPLGLLVTRHDIQRTLLIHPYCGWLQGRQTSHQEKTQSIKRNWLKDVYLVWSLCYQQWSSSLCDVRLVLTNGCIRPGAVGSDSACQIAVAVALSHGVLHSLTQRSPWDLERGSVFFQLGFPPADFCLPFSPLFSIFIYFPPLPFPLFFSPLSRLSHSSLFSCEFYLCDLGFTFFKASKLKVITHLPGRHLCSMCHNMNALCSVKGHHSIEISVA